MRLRRLTLTRRDDGRTYLDRWGVETRFGGIYLHHITAPDPGLDLHNHPWWFASIILKGWYVETVAGDEWTIRVRRRWSLRSIRLEQAHRIIRTGGNVWTLVVRGRRVRQWGFFTRTGYIPQDEYKSRGLNEC